MSEATLDLGDARVVAARAGSARRTHAETVPLASAVGRVLVADLRFLTDLPSFPTSAMDGWVVSGQPPWRLGSAIVNGERPDGISLEPGCARPITTGGVIPAGARGVLRSENGLVHADDRGGQSLHRAEWADAGEPRAGQHVRPDGEEARADDLLAPVGALLTPPRIAAAAVSGHDELSVRARPRVACVLLGSEVDVSGVPAPGRVRDAYSPQLPTVLQSLGAESLSVARVPDDLDATVRALREAVGGGAGAVRPGADLVISTGGSARGSADHMRAALQGLGATLLIDGVAMRPGHPAMLARLPGGVLVLCLPGNPLAAMMTMISIGVPVIDGMLARVPRPAPPVVLHGDVVNPRDVSLVLAYRAAGGNAEPVGWRGSAMLRGLAHADGVLVVPPGGARSGESVSTLPLPW